MTIASGDSLQAAVALIDEILMLVGRIRRGERSLLHLIVDVGTVFVLENR